MAYYRPSAVGGGGSVTYNQWVLTMDHPGPASYATGGFVIDLSKTYSTLNDLDLAVTALGANLPPAHFEIALNSPIAGKATVKVMRHRYSRVSALGVAQNPPAGVTIAATSGQVSSSELTHTHAIDHDHASFASGAPTGGGGNTLLDAAGPLSSQHTHNLDLPNLAGTSGAGTTHNHTDNTIYEHGHGANQTATNITASELPNATNLTATTFRVYASGVRL